MNQNQLTKIVLAIVVIVGLASLSGMDLLSIRGRNENDGITILVNGVALTKAQLSTSTKKPWASGGNYPIGYTGYDVPYPNAWVFASSGALAVEVKGSGSFWRGVTLNVEVVGEAVGSKVWSDGSQTQGIDVNMTGLVTSLKMNEVSRGNYAYTFQNLNALPKPASVDFQIGTRLTFVKYYPVYKVSVYCPFVWFGSHHFDWFWKTFYVNCGA